MKSILLPALFVCFSACLANGQNLLLNGDFNTPDTVISTNASDGTLYAGAPDDWTPWSYGGGWANHQNNTNSFDGSFYMGVGGSNEGSSGGGVYQMLSAAPGLTYELAVESSVQAWWWPSGEMRIFFLDSGGTQLSESVSNVTTGITANDTGLPWAEYSLLATAPAGTSQIKVEFASQSGTGTVFFDDATLTVVPEPSVWAMLAIGSLALIGCRRGYLRSRIARRES